MIDTISDMLIRIKNASAVKKNTVSLPYSKIKMEIALILEREGYIGKAEHKGKKAKKIIEIPLIYDEDKNSAVNYVKRVSKPSRRVYVSAKNIEKRAKNKGLFIISTPKGLLTGSEAKKANLGGEILFYIF